MKPVDDPRHCTTPRILDIYSCHWYPRIRQSDTVSKKFCSPPSSPVKFQVSQEYSKNRRTSERKTWAFVLLHKYRQRHKPTSSKFIALQQVRFHTICRHRSRKIEDLQVSACLVPKKVLIRACVYREIIIGKHSRESASSVYRPQIDPDHCRYFSQ